MSEALLPPDADLDVSFGDIARHADLIVLDVDGVVFNDPIPRFLYELGERTRESGLGLRIRWRRELRAAFWEGRIDEPELWKQLAPDLDPDVLRDELETRYRRGPLYDEILATDAVIWVLTNHHTPWLLERLDQFGIADRFERVLVSDALGVTAPDLRAFAPVLDERARRRVAFIDDQQEHARAAAAVGLAAHHINRNGVIAPL